MHRIFLTLVAVCLLTCCNKDPQGTGKRGSLVEISISGIFVGKTFAKGTILPLKATMTGKGNLFGYKITLSRSSDGAILTSKEEKRIQQIMNVNHEWVNTVPKLPK